MEGVLCEWIVQCGQDFYYLVFGCFSLLGLNHLLETHKSVHSSVHRSVRSSVLRFVRSPVRLRKYLGAKPLPCPTCCLIVDFV